MVYRKLAILVVVCLTIAIGLTACSDEPTSAPTAAPANNPQPTQAPAPTAFVSQPTPASTTAPATTVAASATSPAASTDATTAPATTAATMADSTQVLSQLPAIKNATEVKLDQAALNNLVHSLGIPGAATKLYTSNDAEASLANNTQSTLLAAGYQANLLKPLKKGQAGDTSGLFSKANNPDIQVTIATVPANYNGGNLPGLTPAQLQQIVSQVKGKRSLMLLIAAPGLVRLVTGGSIEAPTPSK